MSDLSKASLIHYISELKKCVYDDDKKKAITLIDDMHKQLSNNEYSCERCNSELSAEDYQCGGSMCEQCCNELNDGT